MLKPILTLALIQLLARSAASGQQAPSRFRSSLTATVADGPASAACQVVSLHWSTQPHATSYRAYVARAHGGPWSAITSDPVCGTVHAEGSTAVAHAVRRTGNHADTTSRRLFYRVLALGAGGPVDSTDVVPIDLGSTSSQPPHKP